ncbi:hypothetical protein [Sphaerisporangium corydalis]|uniref:Transposase n=1 Tax=Sphaerisporangium corydalis TaxID=1441875 RepID=A0ABV9EDQ1_9ACTN|nr:hypothetical protein [Sphaerisporangium corydalis]
MLERFWRGLKRREIYADTSTKWRNPQAELLEGDQWEAIRPDVLTALSLPDSPDQSQHRGAVLACGGDRNRTGRVDRG